VAPHAGCTGSPDRSAPVPSCAPATRWLVAAEVVITAHSWFIQQMSDRSGEVPGEEVRRRSGVRVPSVPVDTGLRPRAKAVPDLSVIAGIYLDSVRNGQRPIQALMERFNVDRDSAKAWPELCRAAGLLPARDQPQIVALPGDDASHRLRFVG
jgi:hypothetical protein